MYKTYKNLEELEYEWKRLHNVKYSGKTAILLEKIRLIYPSFVPVLEDEIYHRAKYLNIKV